MGGQHALQRTAAGLAVVAVLLAGASCAPASSPSGTSSVPSGLASTGAGALPATPAAGAAESPADLAHLRIAIEPAWSGFASPVYVANAGDGSGRLCVVEQAGTVRVIRNGRVLGSPYLDLRRVVLSGGERGLLGMAFAPDFKTNGHVYVDYTDLHGNTVIARYTAPDPASDSPSWGPGQTVLRIVQPYPNHKGGCLQFGPDGLLYIGMGDGGSEGDPDHRGQNPATLLGKMLRIDVEGPTAGAAYAIPSGQPVKPGWAPQNWMIGLRNPWRFSFDASSGALWIGDVGQNLWEEIDVAPAGSGGQNWGWSLWEGNHPYPPGSSPSRAGFTFPIFEYPHPRGETVTGGYVYRGSRNPALVGTYLFADYIKGWVAGIRLTAPDGTALSEPAETTLLQTTANPSSFGVDESGELYLVDYGGTVYRITASAK